MDAEPSVLALFRADPFGGERPIRVRAVRWRYWFTGAEAKRATGAWWRREDPEDYGPTLERKSDGTIGIAD
jgi:hypothetical protein